MAQAAAAVRTHEVAFFQQLAVILAVLLHGGPHRHHQLHTHGVQLVAHGLHVRPILGVKAPVALMRPVEEVRDHHAHWHTAAVILARHVQQLFLRLIAKLALPEAEGEIRHHGHAARGGGIELLKARGRIAAADPVIHLAGGLGLPFSYVTGECDAAYGRIIPEHAVAKV